MPSSFFATEVMKMTFMLSSTAMMPFCIWDMTWLNTWLRLFCLNMRSCIRAMMALYSAAWGSLSEKPSTRASKLPSEKRSSAAITWFTRRSRAIMFASTTANSTMLSPKITASRISPRLLPSSIRMLDSRLA